MPKIRAEEPRERARRQPRPWGHLGWLCVWPWAPQPGALSAPVWVTHPPWPGGDVAPHDWLPWSLSLLLFLPSLSPFWKLRRKIQKSRKNFSPVFQNFKTPYLPHPESDLSDSSWRVFVFESSIIPKWFGGCLIVISGGSLLISEPAAESKVMDSTLGFLSFYLPFAWGFFFYIYVYVW